VDRARLGHALLSGFEGGRVLRARQDHVCAILTQLCQLDGRRGLRDKDGGRHPEASSSEGIGHASVPARSHHDPDGGVQFAPGTSGQHPVEGSPSLERARVLKELQLEECRPRGRLWIQLDDRRFPHVSTDSGLRRLDVSSLDHRVEP
jgi:hypothetical protein